MKNLADEKTLAVQNRPGILLVSTADVGGGAEISAWNLFNTYRGRGYETELAVGTRRTNAPGIFLIPGDSARNAWARFWIRAGETFTPYEKRKIRGTTRARFLCEWVGEPRRSFGRARGHEDFDYPGTRQLLDRDLPDVVHCFNLHPDYFDLRILPRLSHARPLLLDLRDAWLLSGHCAHSFDCDRWKTGCGQCPDLGIYPSISSDGTEFNWRRKQKIFSQSRLYVACPSQWLMNKVQESMLRSSVIESRVIPTGIDLSIFHPGDRQSIRQQLNIPADARVILFAGNGLRRNPWKDYKTLNSALHLLADGERADTPLLFIGLGDKENSPDVQIGNARLRYVPHTRNAQDVASYFQAADLYVHAPTADTFPRVVLEALGCGTPVVATSVGGVPEQIRSLWDSSVSESTNATGIAVPQGNAPELARAMETLLNNKNLARALSENAAKDASNRFDLKLQADRYLEWYQQLAGGKHILSKSTPRSSEDCIAAK